MVINASKSYPYCIVVNDNQEDYEKKETTESAFRIQYVLRSKQMLLFIKTAFCIKHYVRLIIPILILAG